MGGHGLTNHHPRLPPPDYFRSPPKQRTKPSGSLANGAVCHLLP